MKGSQSFGIALLIWLISFLIDYWVKTWDQKAIYRKKIFFRGNYPFDIIGNKIKNRQQTQV